MGAGITFTVSLFCLFSFISTLAAQQRASPWILNISEVDQDGGHFTILKEPGIVDISSEIQIKIDKDFLRIRTGELDSTSSFQTLLATAINLEKAARLGMAAIPGLTTALVNWGETDGKNLNELQRQLSSAAPSALSIISLAPRGSRLRDRLNPALGRGGSTVAQYRAVFAVAAEEANLLRTDVDEILKEEGRYFQLGAWINTQKGPRPIHLSGFDLYPEGPKFEIKRWNLVPSQAQREDFIALRNRVAELNRTGFSGIVEDLKKSTPPVVLRIFAVVDSCSKTLETSFRSVLNSGQANVAEIKMEIRQVAGLIEEYKNYIIFLKIKYDTPGELFTEPLAAAKMVQADFEEVRVKTKTLVDKLRDVKDFADRMVRNNHTVALMSGFAKSIESCSGELRQSVTKTAESVRDVVAGLVSLRNIETDLLQFGDKVQKLDIASLADSTKFSLDNAGVRDAGDVLVVKIAAGRGESEDTRKELEVRQIHLYRVLLHTEIIVTPILAIPASTNQIKSEFQFAASSSLLFRWGSRHSAVTNKLLQPGLGFNFSMLDFDNDNSPEVGVGLVLSLLRDFAQLGGGFNVHEKVFFGFFGFRMPLSPAIPVQ